jgi:hypothetical protein
MPSSVSLYVGIDTTSGHKAFTYAALDRGLRVAALADAEFEEMLAFLDGQEAAFVAINAPSHVNVGLVRKSLEQQSLAPRQFRGVDMRVAEHELRERGIAVSATSSRQSLCPAWVQLGLDLYGQLARMGFQPYPKDGSPRQLLETHPHAAFSVLLGHNPLSKPSLEGRLQRELVLFERGVGIKDPMNFFEEITRHKLLAGSLPVELLHQSQQLDALVAAYTAWVAAEKPVELTRLGSAQEGFIHLPVSVLKESYSA